MTQADDAPDRRSDDFERGLQRRRAILGEAWVERSTADANGFNADFQEFITRYAWHEVWGRPGLDDQTRRLLVLGMTMGLARWEEFELHCRASVRGGVPVQAIQETLLQGAIYCGVPAANTAFKIAGEILRSEGLLPGPQPLLRACRPRVQHTFSQPQLGLVLQGEGAGVPIVFSHALGLDLHLWDGLAAELAGAHPTLRYDQRGHGESARPDPAAGAWGLAEMADDAARLIQEWGRGPVLFVGLSMGGMVGQDLALRYPQLLRGLVLAHTTARYDAAAQPVWQARIDTVRREGMAGVAEAVLQRYLHAGFRAAQPQAAARLQAQLLAQDATAYAQACEAVRRVDYLDRLGAIRCPTLLIAGALDAAVPPATMAAMQAKIAGARLEVLAQSSHLSPLEQPAELTALVRAFAAAL